MTCPITEIVATTAAALPPAAELRNRLQMLALLDAIMMTPPLQHRCFTYDPNYGPGIERTRFEDGAGDEFAVIFDKDTAYLSVFGHVPELSAYGDIPKDPKWGIVLGILQGLPEELEQFVRTNQFSPLDPIWTTLGWWNVDGTWRFGAPLPILGDGGASMLRLVTWQTLINLQ